MARRRFELPGIHDLSKEQEDARALPKQGQHLVIGGPGTGKSILALLRSRRHQQGKEDYVFLVYNRLLNQASRQLCGTSLKSRTWNAWFQSMFRQKTKKQVPKLPSVDGDNWREIDWDAVLQIIEDVPPQPQPDYLIIDEGQDMPPQFYQSLVNLGFENFYVVADQNQQIVPDRNSSRKDIEDALAIEPADVIELRDNYRNTYPIARLARAFYTNDPASPPPQLPQPRAFAKRPILFEYGAKRSTTFQRVISGILKTADANPRELIGIITPNNEVRHAYVHALRTIDVKLDNERPRILSYQSGQDSQLPFDEGGIMVINAKSSKGLEFDRVFLADIDKHPFWPAISDEKKRLFYVMVARAKSHVVMLKEAGRHCPLEDILPQDPDMLERR